MTQIFSDYTAFLNREDKSINGVSPKHAEAHPNWEADNVTNRGCWNCSGCSDCSGCSRCSYCSGCSDCSDCSYCSRCSYCSGCSDCSDCSYCSYCSDCSGCSRCSYCSGCSDCSDCSYCSYCYKQSDTTNTFDIPVIPNIHQTILEAASGTDALNMDAWHTCDTTHCRAGWVVVKAGEKGLELERETSTLFAAMQIYKASSPIRVSPVRFFEPNDVAMKDMVRCAEEERALA